MTVIVQLSDTHLVGSGRLAYGKSDRLGALRLMPFVLLPMAIGFLVMSGAESVWLTAVGMMLMGATQGANSTVPNAFWAEAYGTRHLGAIKSMATAIMVFGTALGPGITGLAIDLGLGIEAQFVFIAGYFAFATVMMLIGVSRARAALPAAP